MVKTHIRPIGNLEDARLCIKSKSALEKTAGFAWIRDYFNFHRNDPAVASIGHNAIRILYEDLFHIISEDRQIWLRQTGTNPTKSAAASRLGEGAAALRSFVGATVSIFSKEQASNVINHVMQMLLLPDGGFLLPIELEYLKILRTVLDYQPHTEHLKKTQKKTKKGIQWKEILEFCIDGLHENREQSSSTLGERHKGTFTSAGNELLGSLKALVVVSNAPLSQCSVEVLNFILSLLQDISSQTTISVSEGFSSCFTILRVILNYLSLCHSSVISNVLPTLLTVLGKLLVVSNRVTFIREEIFMIILNLQPQLASIAYNAERAQLENHMTNLADALLDEYVNETPNSKQRLDLDDLDLSTNRRVPLESMPMQYNSYSLRTSNADIDSQWTHLHLAAFCNAWLDVKMSHSGESSDATSTGEDEDGRPIRTSSAKRRRISTRFEGLLARVSQVSGITERTRLLQVTCFSIELQSMSIAELGNVLVQMTELAAGRDGQAASWAFLCLSSCLFKRNAGHESLKEPWLRVAQLAMQKVSIPSICRVACQTLKLLLSNDILQYRDMSKGLDSIMSAGSMSGPAILCDSALELWERVVQLKAHHQPGVGGSSDRHAMLQWICYRWNLNDAVDQRKITSVSRSHLHLHVSSKLLWLFGRADDLHIQYASFPRLERLSRCWLEIHERSNLSRLLMMLDNNSLIRQDSSKQEASEPLRVISRADEKLESMLAGYLETEVDKMISSWHDIRSIGSIAQRHEAMLNLFQSCSSVLTLRGVFARSDTEQLEPIFQGSTHVFQLLINYACGSSGCEGLRDAIAGAFLAFLPSPACIVQTPAAFRRLQDLSELLAIFAAKIQGLKPANVHMNRASDGDALDEDFGEDSQRSRQQEVLDEASSRRYHQALTSPQASHSSALLYISFLQTLCARSSLLVEKTFPEELVDSLRSSSAGELIQALPLLKRLLDAGFVIKPEHTDTLLHHVATCYMLEPEEATQLSLSSRSQSLGADDIYHWDRCESAISVCAIIMAGTAQDWSETDPETLSAIGEAIYLWLYDLTSRESEVSSTVKMHFVDLLYRLLDFKADYADGFDGIPSIRTTLFNLLQNGTIEVKYQVTVNLQKVFRPFAASQHEQILTDIHEILPNDDSWAEGLAVRIYVFMTLGSALRSLLRHCSYHILQTAGLVRASRAQAARALRYITRAVGLETPRELLQVLKSQLLYTWLSGSHPLESLPYSIFEYSGLAEMLTDLKIDTVSILAMRGHEPDGLQTLNHFLSLTSSTLQPLLEESFPRALAYVLAKDVGSTSGTSPSNTCENWLKASITTARFGQLLLEDYHFVIGHVISRLDKEDTIAKYLEKQMGYALNILNDMKSLSCSNEELSTAHQPNIKPKLLPNIIQRMRNRLKPQGIEELWSPKLLTAVYRMLLNDLNPTLGDQHTIRVVRRIRIVVAISGSTSLSSYPLEQVLHGLRPIITNSRCNDDAIGVFRYLLDKGRAHLQTRPSFVAGLLTALFLEMLPDGQRHDAVSADNRDKLQSLHRWLAQYLDRYQPTGLQAQDAQQFRRLIESARRMSEAPNATVGKPESQLLLALLDEKDGRNSLLSERARSTTLKLFFKHFQAPIGSRDDILGGDEASTAYASRLWTAAQAIEGNEDFLLWTAKVLGRSFSCSGEIPKDFLVESDLRRRRIAASLGPGFSGVIGSKAALLHSMENMLQSDKSKVVGLVEAAIQEYLIRYANSEDLERLEQILPSSVLEAYSMTSQKRKATDQYLRTFTPSDAESSQSYDANLNSCFTAPELRTTKEWLCDLVVGLASHMPEEPLFIFLPRLVRASPGIASRIFPFVLHLVLQNSIKSKSDLRMEMSVHLAACFGRHKEIPVGHLRALIDAVLYLRSQKIPGERTSFDRNGWLNVTFDTVAQAALKCNMQRTALLFIEINRTQKTIGRPPSASGLTVPHDLLLSAFQDLEEPDSFYGIHEASTLTSVAERLMHEGNAIQGMLYLGAQLDAVAPSSGMSASVLQSQLLQAMGQVNMNTIIQDLVTAGTGGTSDVSLMQSMTDSALHLGRWDVSLPPEADGNTAVLYRALQGVSSAVNMVQAQNHVRTGLLNLGTKLTRRTNIEASISESLATVAALNEIDLVLTARSHGGLSDVLALTNEREEWMKTGRTKDVSVMLQSRKSLMRIVSSNRTLQKELGIQSRDSLLAETNTLIRNSTIFRKLGSFERSLSTITFLSSMTQAMTAEGITADAAVTYEISNSLRDRGELVSSINMLRKLVDTCDFEAQDIATSPSEVVATLGRRIADARFEKPIDIVSRYLESAVQRLEREDEHGRAGRAYHIFATYCHEQLSNKEALEDFHRMKKFRAAKAAEVDVLKQLSRTRTREGVEAKDATRKATSWLQIDDKEFARVKEMREDFIRKSLNCYLECLQCSDEYDTDATRFTALWMEHSDNDTATTEVAQRLATVSSRKFVPLMNQLASRLQNSQDSFHLALSQLVEKICVEHPFHGMHYMHAGKYTTGGKDPKAISRQQAAAALTDRLNKRQETQSLWSRITRADAISTYLAALKDDDLPTGVKVNINELEQSKRMVDAVLKYKIPPITKSIAIKADKNYGVVPHVVSYGGQISILGGLSKPKLVTELLSDGTQHKEIFKGGSDDMRQDAIMEQVFVEATSILKNNKATRQRNLTIRTYNVVPLDATNGVIEFAQNTHALLEYLEPAHSRYHPNDWTWKTCRKKIDAVSKLQLSARIKVYRDAVEHFSPVMRHYFFEKYDDPDTWYERRLAYTRSTAAISILGHVLGLGDRHNQNVLLDHTTGEVVHIDHGVAFEAGRILPLPELIPFRLTRDIVDGFGVLGTEGVFRRCCEFTLEALRENRDTIMTLLNVLRYDPLHNWSVSPLRARRLQREQDTSESEAPTPAASRAGTRRSLGGPNALLGTGAGGAALDLKIQGRDMHEDEGGEADRALSVVEKKLGKELSVQAAVNELIQQATDENNLAQLFQGWAAFA